MKPQKMYKILRIKKEEAGQVTPTEPMLTNEWAHAFPVGVLPVLITFICYLSNLSLSNARTLFKHKYAMTENVKMNFKGNVYFARELWKCTHCKNQDNESHLLWCPKYEDMRKDLNIRNDVDLCNYLFQEKI